MQRTILTTCLGPVLLWLGRGNLVWYEGGRYTVVR